MDKNPESPMPPTSLESAPTLESVTNVGALAVPGIVTDSLAAVTYGDKMWASSDDESDVKGKGGTDGYTGV